jgi:hypothetical protein
MKAVQKSSRAHALYEQLKFIENESILSKKRPLEKLQDCETDIVMDICLKNYQKSIIKYTKAIIQLINVTITLINFINISLGVG